MSSARPAENGAWLRRRWPISRPSPGFEEEFREARTFWNCIADRVAAFSGSIAFVLLHVGGFCFWFFINLGWLPSVRVPFDPYPLSLLGTAVACEAVLLSTFVLMKQNWMNAKASSGTIYTYRSRS